MTTIPFTGSPAGFFIASPGALTSPSSLLADNIDPDTNDFASLFTGMDVIDAQVLVAVTIVRGSGPAVIEDGIKFTSRKMTESIKTEVEADVRTALQKLINNGDIEFTEIDFGDDDENIDPSNQVVNTRVEYVNLRARDSTVRSLPLSFLPAGV